MKNEILKIIHELICDKYKSMMRQDMVFIVAGFIIIFMMAAFAGWRFVRGEYFWFGLYTSLAVTNLWSTLRLVKSYMKIRAIYKDFKNLSADTIKSIEVWEEE